MLVGNEKTLADQEKLWHYVKKLNPKCLKEMPSVFHWRVGLCTALRTTNPVRARPGHLPRASAKPADDLVYKMEPGAATAFISAPGVTRWRSPSSAAVPPLRRERGAGLRAGDPQAGASLASAAEDAERLAGSRWGQAPEIRSTRGSPSSSTTTGSRAG